MYEDTIHKETIYSEESREQMLEDGIINAWEEGFMQGWDEAELED